MELIIFSDYRLVHKFTEFCANDIEKLKCGRLEVSSESMHTQGETIDCLEKFTDKLTDKCKHQILRIAELQSDDFHLDRALYFACRDDRENFCHRIQSGEGRVYRCLMRHKLEREMSRNCREKLFQREMLAVRDYKVAHGLAKGMSFILNLCQSKSEFILKLVVRTSETITAEKTLLIKRR